MLHIHLSPRTIFATGFLALLTILLVYGCASEEHSPATTAPEVSELLIAPPTKGRAQIWGENCARCHNMRPPDWYSDAQWELSMQHMRVRGYLTGSEQRAVEELLKAGN